MEATSLKEHEYNVAKTENGESGSGRNQHGQYATDESGGYSYESGCTGQCGWHAENVIRPFGRVSGICKEPSGSGLFQSWKSDCRISDFRSGKDHYSEIFERHSEK